MVVQGGPQINFYIEPLATLNLPNVNDGAMVQERQRQSKLSDMAHLKWKWLSHCQLHKLAAFPLKLSFLRELSGLCFDPPCGRLLVNLLPKTQGFIHNSYNQKNMSLLQCNFAVCQLLGNLMTRGAYGDERQHKMLSSR